MAAPVTSKPILPPIHKPVDVEIHYKKESLSSFQTHIINDLCTEEYFTFISNVEKNLHLEKYSEIRHLFKRHAYNFQLPLNYRKDFDTLLQKVLDDVKDGNRFHKASELIKIMTKNHVSTQFAQLCEIVCLYYMGEKENAEKKLKDLANFACVKSYSEVLSQQLDFFKVYRHENLFNLFMGLKEPLKGIRQQILPPIKA